MLSLRFQLRRAGRISVGAFNCFSCKVGLLACCGGLLVVSGCGSRGIAGLGGSQAGTPVKGENTTVTVVLTSTANDQLMQYGAFLNSLTLTSQSGAKVNLLSAAQRAEFDGLNGEAEPLVTLSIPQDVYTSASATIGFAEFGCAGYAQGSQQTNTYQYGETPDSDVTVDLPAKLTVAGQPLGLLLNLDVAKSASWSPQPCWNPLPHDVYSITPTFDLTSFVISGKPTAPWNGNFSGLSGLVASAPNANGMFTVTSADGTNLPSLTGATGGIVWNVSTDSSTILQGIPKLASLTQGMTVMVDGTLLPTGSILASRIDVVDSDTSTPSLFIGQLLQIDNSEPAVVQYDRQNEGTLLEVIGGAGYVYSGANFEISPAFTNLSSLPFPATFNSQTMVAGQNTLITSHATTVSNFGALATTVMLIPQTIDGTVEAVNTVGGLTAYTVTLASYDTFPSLAFTNSEQTSPLTDPSTVTVYADGSTAMLSSQTPAPGGVFRFYGLVFNDHGALKMDCSQISDGVPE